MNTTLRRWMVSTVGRQALAPLTGQDAAALEAVYCAALLWGKSDVRGRRCAQLGILSIIRAMQTTTQHLAIGAVIAATDWGLVREIIGPLDLDEAVIDAARTLLQQTGNPVDF